MHYYIPWQTKLFDKLGFEEKLSRLTSFTKAMTFFENETNLRSYDVKREIESINMWIAVWVFLEQHLCNWSKFRWMWMKMALKLNYHVTFSTMNLFTFEMCSEICFKNWFQCLKKVSTLWRSAKFIWRSEKISLNEVWSDQNQF